MKSVVGIYRSVCRKHYALWDLCSKAVRWETHHLRKYHLGYCKFPSCDQSAQEVMEIPFQ